MITALLVILILLDLGLLAAVVFLSRRQDAQVELVSELTEERRVLSELRATVQEELEAAQGKARETLAKAAKLAAEAEQEVKTGGTTIAQEMETVVSELSTKFETPLKELAKRQAYVETLLKRVDEQKVLLQRLVQRGEKICKFFDERIPYEEVLHEIEDKKYADARTLLAKGHAPSSVARELGMSETEVRLVAGIAGRP